MARLPRAVQQQADRAQELLRAGQEPPANPEASQQPPGPVVHNPDLKQPPAASPSQEPPAAASPQPPAQEPAQEPQAQPQQQQPTQTSQQDQEIESLTPDQLKQRLRSVQGLLRTEADNAKRYRAEKDRLSGVVESLSNLVTNLQNQVAQLSERVDAGEEGQQPQADGGSPKPQATGTERLNPEDYDGYGDEMVAMVEKVNALLVENEQLKQQYGQVDQRFQQMGQDVTQRDFYRDLSYHAPDWEQINPREDWKLWLTKPETPERLQAGEVYGWSRDQILKDAYRRGDGKRVAKLVNDFKGDMGIAGNPAPQPQVHAQAGGGNGNGLESQVMPEPGGGGSSPNPAGPGAQGQKVTPQDLQAAAEDVARGKPGAKERYDQLIAQFTTSMQGGAAGAPPR